MATKGIEDRVRQNLDRLIRAGEQLAHGRPDGGQVFDEHHRSECVGWLAAASHAVSLVCGSDRDPYRVATARIVESNEADGYTANDAVGSLAAVLRQLAADVDNGLVASVVAVASAETLDDLLDQAEEYHRRSRKEGAGILATAVFEDTIRRTARVHKVSDAGVSLENLISTLTKDDVITSIVAKRCRAAAGVRNGALHAQWGGVTIEDVDSVIRLTRQLLSECLSG